MAANEEQQKEQRDLREPAHHARRPMNAFLIFCKRHRGSVRSGFPHLENRAVTRVLGEWWATLNPDQKKSYTNLAQEYKDAFLNANPDFKWYKLPAPPLRTLNTRPTNKKSETAIGSRNNDASNEVTKSDYSESSDYDRKSNDNEDNQSIQPGKLADESQIGGLSSLFTPQKSNSIPSQQNTNDRSLVNVPLDNHDNSVAPKPPKKRYTELPVQIEQKRECKVDLFGENKGKEESNNNERHHVNIEDEKNGNHFFEATNVVEESNNRGERTCKGLRYQKFLAEQLRNVGSTTAGTQSKRRRVSNFPSAEERSNERRNSISSNISEKTDSLSSEGGSSSRGELEHLVESAEGKLEASKPEDTETEGAENQLDFGPWISRKRFKAEDFNLEKRIEALPSLSLEEFQEKKKQQRTKKKKIVQKLTTMNSHKKQNNTTANLHHSATVTKKSAASYHSANQEEDSDKHLLVGSQKRKARKQSITRNAPITKQGLTYEEEDGEHQQEPQQQSKAWCSSPDLEALACLATVAANRTKLTK